MRAAVADSLADFDANNDAHDDENDEDDNGADPALFPSCGCRNDSFFGITQTRAECC